MGFRERERERERESFLFFWQVVIIVYNEINYLFLIVFYFLLWYNGRNYDDRWFYLQHGCGYARYGKFLRIYVDSRHGRCWFCTCNNCRIWDFCYSFARIFASVQSNCRYFTRKTFWKSKSTSMAVAYPGMEYL